MNEFWLWFMRPVAETLGTIALLAAFIVVTLLVLAAWVVVGTVHAESVKLIEKFRRWRSE